MTFAVAAAVVVVRRASARLFESLFGLGPAAFSFVPEALQKEKEDFACILRLRL